MKLSSEAEAEQLILSILPQTEIRQKCLMMLADSIAEANIYGRDKWAVTYELNGGKRVRLIVGHIIVCTLEKGRIWLALDEGLLESGYQSFLEKSGDWEWYKGKYAKYRAISSKNGYYLPSEKHVVIWPGMRRLHFESIYKAANGRILAPESREGHSSEILKYLRNELGQHVPDPLD